MARALRVTLGTIIGLVTVGVPLVSQVPLPDALRAARRVYLERGSGVERKELDRIAQDIARSRPARLIVVAERENAEIVLTVAITEGDGGTMVAPIAGLGVFAVPLTNPVAHLSVRSTTDDRVLWDDVRRGKNVRDLVKALLKRLTESGPPPPLTIVKAEPLPAPAALLSPQLGVKDSGELTCLQWLEVRIAAAAADSAVKTGRPLDPDSPDPATLFMTDRIMVVAITAWLQGHFHGAFDLGFWLGMNGLVDERTGETIRAGFDAQLRMLEPEAIAPWVDTFCATHPGSSVGTVAVRLLRDAYPFRVKMSQAPATSRR